MEAHREDQAITALQKLGAIMFLNTALLVLIFVYNTLVFNEPVFWNFLRVFLDPTTIAFSSFAGNRMDIVKITADTLVIGLLAWVNILGFSSLGWTVVKRLPSPADSSSEAAIETRLADATDNSAQPAALPNTKYWDFNGTPASTAQPIVNKSANNGNANGKHVRQADLPTREVPRTPPEAGDRVTEAATDEEAPA